MSVHRFLTTIITALFVTLFSMCVVMQPHVALAVNYSSTNGFTPVYAAGPDDNNHADQVPDGSKMYCLYSLSLT